MTLPAEIRELIEGLRREVADLWRENGALRAENEALRAENAELRRRLDQDSSTSSKPPSSDGLRKKPRVPGSLRGRSGKASGGQPGHKGDTLRRVETPDRIVRHEAATCRHCHAALAASMQTGMEARQVFDLPERLIEVTEHQAAIYACAHCRGETRAAFPAGVSAPAQYGERLRAAAVYLNVQQLIPEDRVAQTLSICSARFASARTRWRTGWRGTRGRSSRSSPGSLRWLRPRRCAASTKPGFASPAAAIGCTPSPPTP